MPRSARCLTRPSAAIAAAILLLWHSPGAAQLRPIQIEPAALSVLAGGGETGRVLTVVPGDVLLETGLAYSEAARLIAPVRLTLADAPVALPAGAVLLKMKARGGAFEALPKDSQVFCADEEPAPAGGGERYRKRIALCFVDQDGDGRFDSAFLQGARKPADLNVARLRVPIRYARQDNIPIPGAKAQVLYMKGAPLQGPVLEFRLTMGGYEVPIRGVRMPGAKGPRQWFPIERTVKRSAYPHTIAFGAAEIAILGFVQEGRRLTIRVDKPFESAPMAFDYRFNTITIYR